MKIPAAIIALSAALSLTGCAGIDKMTETGKGYTRYCEPGSAVVRKTRGTIFAPARPAAPHGTCKS